VTALREIASEDWASFLDRATGELYNAEVSIEIVGVPNMEARGLALQALSYDPRDDVFEVSAAHGDAHVPGVLRHLIGHPKRIAVDSPDTMAPTVVAVDDRDGTRTVIRIERPPEFSG
jgi:Family of unknown function (DUF5335)